MNLPLCSVGGQDLKFVMSRVHLMVSDKNIVFWKSVFPLVRGTWVPGAVLHSCERGLFKNAVSSYWAHVLVTKAEGKLNSPVVDKHKEVENMHSLRSF